MGSSPKDEQGASGLDGFLPGAAERKRVADAAEAAERERREAARQPADASGLEELAAAQAPVEMRPAGPSERVEHVEAQVAPATATVSEPASAPSVAIDPAVREGARAERSDAKRVFLIDGFRELPEAPDRAGRTSLDMRKASAQAKKAAAEKAYEDAPRTVGGNTARLGIAGADLLVAAPVTDARAQAALEALEARRTAPFLVSPTTQGARSDASAGAAGVEDPATDRPVSAERAARSGGAGEDESASTGAAGRPVAVVALGKRRSLVPIVVVGVALALCAGALVLRYGAPSGPSVSTQSSRGSMSAQTGGSDATRSSDSATGTSDTATTVTRGTSATSSSSEPEPSATSSTAPTTDSSSSATDSEPPPTTSSTRVPSTTSGARSSASTRSAPPPSASLRTKSTTWMTEDP